MGNSTSGDAKGKLVYKEKKMSQLWKKSRIAFAMDWENGEMLVKGYRLSALR